MKLFLHPQTELHIQALLRQPYGTVLLFGANGVGKTTAARELAHQITTSEPDIIMVEPDEKGTIGVQAVHRLHHDLTYQSYQANANRVAIIDQAESLSLPAQNALLKLLEEPPSNTVIILTARDKTTLLDTVLSRCRSIYMPPLSIDQITAAVVEHAHLPVEEAHHIATLSRGAVGTALALATDTELQQKHQQIEEQIRKLTSGDMFDRLQNAAKLATQSNELPEYIDRLAARAHQQVRDLEVPSFGPLEALQRLQERLSARVSPRVALEAYVMEVGA